MDQPTMYYLPNCRTAMGFPKKHLSRKCRHVIGVVLTEVPATNRIHRNLTVCKDCAKNWRKEHQPG